MHVSGTCECASARTLTTRMATQWLSPMLSGMMRMEAVLMRSTTSSLPQKDVRGNVMVALPLDHFAPSRCPHFDSPPSCALSTSIPSTGRAT